MAGPGGFEPPAYSLPQTRFLGRKAFMKKEHTKGSFLVKLFSFKRKGFRRLSPYPFQPPRFFSGEKTRL